jgi:hypothetical protein
MLKPSRGDGRARLVRAAGFCLPAFGGAAVGGRGGLPGIRRLGGGLPGPAVLSGPGTSAGWASWRGAAGVAAGSRCRRCRAAVDVRGGPGLLVHDQGLLGGGHGDAGVPGALAALNAVKPAPRLSQQS